MYHLGVHMHRYEGSGGKCRRAGAGNGYALAPIPINFDGY